MTKKSDKNGICYKLVATTCYENIRPGDLVRSEAPYSLYLFLNKENAEKFCGPFLNKGIEVVEEDSFFTDFILQNCIDSSQNKEYMKNIKYRDKWFSLDMQIQEHSLEAVMKDPYWETCCNSDEYIERRRAYLDAQKFLRDYISSELNEDTPTKLEKNTDKKEDSVTEAEIALWDEVFKLSVAERGEFTARQHADAAIEYRREKFGSR